MMPPPLPLTHDVVFVGGGHAHALVLRSWGMKPVAGARLTLINPDPTAPYTGMLPGFIAGHYARDDLEIDLVRLSRFAGVRFVQGWATGIDREAGLVQVAGHPDIRYDILSLDVGITSDMPKLPGFAEHGVAAKPLAAYATAWERFCAEVTAKTALPEIAVIGGGVAGVELALAMHHRLTTLGAVPRVSVIDRSQALDGVHADTRSVLFDRLYRADIRVLEHSDIAEVEADAVRLTDGRRIPAALTIGAAGARPHDWVSELGLPHEDGFLTVDAALRSVADPAIYGAGDCVHLSHAPRPKAGVYAVRAAPILHHNIRADLTRAQRRDFRPQNDFLKLVSLGGKEAVGDRFGVALSGAFMWTQKDKIDRAFMDRLDDLPVMKRPPLPALHTQPLKSVHRAALPCAGCGGKVGPATLAQTLASVPQPKRTDVLTGIGDDAALLDFGTVTQALSTDHLRAFTEDPVTFARITAIHALGDIWAMGAVPQGALATVILPHMSEAMQAATLREIMESAAAVFSEEGAEILGGHSSLGAEMTIGFTVTGLCAASPVGLLGAQPGDALLLTKPIGTGTLLAGDMRGQTSGPDLQGALAMMSLSQGAAARALSQSTAMTDVTGFGLAGHLWDICKASQVSAMLNLEAIPTHPGALRLAERGVASTLAPANRAALEGVLDAPTGAKSDLLIDPQTAGGLLAALHPDHVRDALSACQDSGLPATVIGHVTDGPPRIKAV